MGGSQCLAGRTVAKGVDSRPCEEGGRDFQTQSALSPTHPPRRKRRPGLALGFYASLARRLGLEAPPTSPRAAAGLLQHRASAATERECGTRTGFGQARNGFILFGWSKPRKADGAFWVKMLTLTFPTTSARLCEFCHARYRPSTEHGIGTLRNTSDQMTDASQF